MLSIWSYPKFCRMEKGQRMQVITSLWVNLFRLLSNIPHNDDVFVHLEKWKSVRSGQDAFS